MQDLSKEQNQKIPNPVLSFEDAFDPFRKLLTASTIPAMQIFSSNFFFIFHPTSYVDVHVCKFYFVTF